ncbi:MAG: aminoacyl-histidine dipeptidase [Bacteroidetes bacterium]|nr:aminoacyl-histidine dipeptidase [Bacteroidota bacterium]
MNEEILALQPSGIWKYFRELLNIPRPSKKEEKVIKYMKEFGENLGLQTVVDEVGNVIIRKNATPGMENRQGVILQGHLDMVPQKNTDTVHDFEKDPISAWVDGEWVKAKGTTLGADNGMGVAATMAVLSAKDLQHGPLEALFTIDEETGMTGAFNLKPGLLHGDILLNLDSEDEGELYVGCAGGTNATMTFTYKSEVVPSGYQGFNLSLKGLKGGHSGLDINMGKGNANKLLFRYLKHAVSKHGLRLASVEGGSLRNAIPREAFATVIVPSENADKLVKCIAEMEAIFKKELSLTEPDLSLTIAPAGLPSSVMDKATQDKLIHAVYGCPNGTIRMSDAMPGLVETSTNLAVVKMDEKTITVLCLLRSSVDSAKEDLEEMIASVFTLAGASVTMDGKYPGWKPNPDSAILLTMKDVYKNHFGKTPDIKAIHAGLECGILSGPYPAWDMISFGPTIRFPHSPDEKVNIPSVNKFWDFLVETLKNIPVKK